MRKLLHPIPMALILSAILCAPVAAQDAPKGTFSQRGGVIAVEAQSYQKTNQHKKAVKTLRKALKLERLTAYEISTLNRMLGASYFSMEKHKKAMRAFESAIEAGGLDEALIETMKSNIAQLNIIEKNYTLGAEQLEAHFSRGGEQKANLVTMLMRAYVQSENREAAVPWAKVMWERDLFKTRKDYDAALYLFDSPRHRVSQIKVANKMQRLWPTDKNLLFKVAMLRGIAQKEGVGAIVIAGKTKVVDSAKAVDYSDVSFQEAKPIIRIPGYMPPEATKSGHCKFIFDVTDVGAVSNIRVKSCSDPVFVSTSLKAMKQWVYSPKIINGKGVISPNVEQILRYRMMNSKGELLPE